MSIYISILRGINLGNHNKIKMETLKAAYESLKFKNVRTYIQSGNVIFESPEKNKQVLEEKIINLILKDLGLKVPVIIRNADEMMKTISANPYVKRKGVDPDYLHVTFLSEEPSQSLVEPLMNYNFPPDEFILAGKEIFLHCPNGYGNTKLNNNFFERKLKVVATTRNWKTVNELGRMAQ